jgi:hypothetical protein
MKAWLDTTPNESKTPRGTTWEGKHPDPGPLAYLGEWLFEVGPVISQGPGQIRPISWTDIKAWSDLSGITPDPNESRAMLDLSRAYLSQHYDSMAPACSPPWLGDKEAISKRIKSIFKAGMS